MAGKANIEIVKGKTFRQSWKFYDGTPDMAIINEVNVTDMVTRGVLTPRNLSSATFSAAAQKAGANTSATKITFLAVLDSSDKDHASVLVSYSATQTTSIAWDLGSWDLTITYPTGDKVVELEGNAKISKAVS